ncbi:MAG: HNH endonuclease [Armatimonadota bacterium]
MATVNRIITYREMCDNEHMQTLQRGMNYHLRNGVSVILMSQRKNAPYTDCVQQNGEILIYEGHDAPRKQGYPDPKSIDQPEHNPTGSLTQNGLFHQAAQRYRSSIGKLEVVRVYEKIMDGVWADNGLFALVDSWQETSNDRLVFKFKLTVLDQEDSSPAPQSHELEHNRFIPTEVKAEVWKRDKGRCVECRSADNLHFDHIIPYSKGGSSLLASNIQLLCARHNLEKSDRIV